MKTTEIPPSFTSEKVERTYNLNLPVNQLENDNLLKMPVVLASDLPKEIKKDVFTGQVAIISHVPARIMKQYRDCMGRP